jgi:hypothetical protein
MSGVALRSVRAERAGEADDAGDLAGEIAGEPVRHEPAVRVADDVQALRIHVVPGLHVGDDGGEVRVVVARHVQEVATRVGRGPEQVVLRVPPALGHREEEGLFVGDGAKLEVRLVDFCAVPP